ncbi:unnamed protein product, partial [Brassica oleracea var. botrytis]
QTDITNVRQLAQDKGNLWMRRDMKIAHSDQEIMEEKAIVGA